MKKIYKNLIVFSLIFVLVLSLAACGGSQSGDQENTSNSTSASSSSTVTDTAVDPLGKYEPGIVLKRVLRTEANFKFLPGESYEDNVWTKEIEKTLGIKFETLWEADASMYETKLGVSLASDEIPDIFYTYDRATFMAFKNAGKLVDLKDSWDKYAVQELKDLAQYYPPAFESVTYDGKVLAIPDLAGSPYSNASLLWIRDDWMKKLGLSAPKTMSDVINIAEAFTTKDPDGNGKNDTYGLALQKDIYNFMGEITGFAAGYHSILNQETNNMWIKGPDGKFAYGAIQPETRNALLALQDMYKKGFINKEFGVMDVNKLIEDFNNNKVGMTFGQNWLSMWPFADIVKKDVNAVFKPYPVPSIDDKPAIMGAKWPISTYYCVTTECKNPEAFIKMANLFRKLAGDENPDRTYDSKDGVDTWKLSPYCVGTVDQEYNVLKLCREYMDSGTMPASATAKQKEQITTMMTWIKDKKPDGYGLAGQRGPDGAAQILYEDYYKNGKIWTNIIKGGDSEALLKKGPTLRKMEEETFTKIIIGNPIDDFDKFVTKWKELGGDEITKEINDTYKN